MKIILIGFMGSGKSSTAKRLGDILNLPVVEMDDLVLKKTNANTMHDVFAKGGEMLLRRTEIEVAKELAQANNCVISTGGGVVLNKVILDCLKEGKGKIFFLNGPFQTIHGRLSDDSSRPLFKNSEEAKSLYDFRLSLYLKYADEVIDVGEKNVEEIAEEIAGNLLKGKKHGQ